MQLILGHQLAAVKGCIHHGHIRMLGDQYTAGNILTIVSVAVEAERKVIQIGFLFHHLLDRTAFHDLVGQLLLLPTAPLVGHLGRFHIQSGCNPITVCQRIGEHRILGALDVLKVNSLAVLFVDFLGNGHQLILRVHLTGHMGDFSPLLQPCLQFAQIFHF